jgi:hypothetical protein
MQVTLTGQCRHCRRPVTLHEHLPAELPRQGDRVTDGESLYIVAAMRESVKIGPRSIEYVLQFIAPNREAAGHGR